MVSSAEIIRAIAGDLDKWHAENIVVDPVMVATSGARLIGDDAIEALKARLLPPRSPKEAQDIGIALFIRN